MIEMKGNIWWLLRGNSKRQSHISAITLRFSSRSSWHIYAYVITSGVPERDVCMLCSCQCCTSVCRRMCLSACVGCERGRPRALHVPISVAAWFQCAQCHSPAIWRRRWELHTAPRWACSRRPQRWTPWLCQPAWRRDGLSGRKETSPPCSLLEFWLLPALPPSLSGGYCLFSPPTRAASVSSR